MSLTCLPRQPEHTVNETDFFRYIVLIFSQFVSVSVCQEEEDKTSLKAPLAVLALAGRESGMDTHSGRQLVRKIQCRVRRGNKSAWHLWLVVSNENEIKVECSFSVKSYLLL